jgi:beta-lactamase regulating signal transducer with metallopeptidase domain
MQTLAQSVFLKALGWSLINSLWQMAVLWLVYFVITFKSKKFTAGVRHSFAAALLSAGVIWFAFTFIYYCNNFQAGNIGSIFLFSELNFLLSFVNKVFDIVNFLLPFFACLYILVLAYQLLQYSRYFFQSNKLVNEGLHKMNPQLRMFAEEIAQRLGIQKKVEVFLSEIADSPMTIGFLKYIILVPLATINNLSTVQVEAILLHELAHIKRNDYLLNLLVTAVEMIFFFNPFCRLLARVIRKERENSCDDLVLQFKYDPHVSVMALLSLEKSRHTHQPLVIAATGKNNKLLLERVQRITGHRTTRPEIKAKLIIFLLISILAGLLLQFQFRIISPVFHSQASTIQERQIKPEMYRVVYRSNTGLAKTKPAKTFKIKIVKAKPLADDVVLNDPEDDNLVYVNAVQPAEDASSEDNVVSTNQAEVANFSIPETKSNDAPTESSSQTEYPYVAKSSFDFEVVADSSAGQRDMETGADMNSKEKLEKNLQKLEDFDWQKIQAAISKNQKGIAYNLKKLRSATRRTLSDGDWKMINLVLYQSAENAVEARIKNEIQIQTEALRDLQSKNRTGAEKLQADILQNQIKLQLSYYQKRQDVLRNINIAKRKLRIVEI